MTRKRTYENRLVETFIMLQWGRVMDDAETVTAATHAIITRCAAVFERSVKRSLCLVRFINSFPT